MTTRRASVAGIARGGAITGSLIAGTLGHRPILAFTVDHDWTDGRRTDGLLFDLIPREPQLLDRVLVVAGEIHSGNSMRYVCTYLSELGAKEIRRVVVYYEAGSTEPVEYVGFRTRRKMVKLPWMFSENYRRLARSDDRVF